MLVEPKSLLRTMEQIQRLAVLRAHLAADASNVEEERKPLHYSPTAAVSAEQNGYCVVLPEHLTPQGPWLVRRSVISSSYLLKIPSGSFNPSRVGLWSKIPPSRIH